MGQKRIRFYTDEHVAKTVIKGLRQRGADVLTASEAGMRCATDEEHIAFSRKEGKVIFTQDVDFLRLHAGGTKHAGIVYASQQASIGEIIHWLMLIYQVLDANDIEGRVEFL